jgi:DUF4097 and DUF4098 domain-containing protein YvlB
MNQTIIPIFMFLVCFVSACLPAPKQYTELGSYVFDSVETQSVLVEVDHGEVIVLGSDDDQVKIGGQTLFAEEIEYQVSSTENQILIKTHINRSDLPNASLQVRVNIPNGMLVKVKTESASVFVSDYQGNLEVASTSGNIIVENVLGKITLQSNRGNITVRESSGDVAVVGNYGLLNTEDVRGNIALSTIMGNVMFNGLIQTGDIVRLETDHGPVVVNLSKYSALGIQVRSTSGDVVCMVPEINSSTRTCDGEYQSNGGMLSVRTVSGTVTMQLIP